MGALLFPLILQFAARYLVVPYVITVVHLAGYLVIQHFRGGTICVQIDPQPFGFRGELPVPDTNAGKAFLIELEDAWKASLKRRFLVRGPVPAQLQLQRIGWLGFIGVLSLEEAAAERSLVDSDAGREPELIESFAVN